MMANERPVLPPVTDYVEEARQRGHPHPEWFEPVPLSGDVHAIPRKPSILQRLAARLRG